jgi:hypothetical protein
LSTTFGSGDLGGTNNDYVASGVNAFWTNWNNSQITTGNLGRIVIIAARWGVCFAACAAPPSCTTVTGHNDVWLVPSLALARASGNGTSTTDMPYGSWNSLGATDYWLSVQNLYMGFWRTASQCVGIPFRDGTYSGYAGKSNDDGNISGGTNNWAGVGNPGGINVLGLLIESAIWVRRSGAWTRAYVGVRRSGAWSPSRAYVNVRRSGAWTPLNFADWMNTTQRHVPERGMPILVLADRGLEQGWLTEEGEGWFGNTDPRELAKQGIDWTKRGSFPMSADMAWTGRYNSSEPEEKVWFRQLAREQWAKALAREDHQESKRLYQLWTPPHTEPAPIFDDPEPILVGCGCS